jgi:hypothetical protein
MGVDVGTLRPHVSQTIGPIVDSVYPYSTRPGFYQITILTRYEAFTEYLFVTPGEQDFNQVFDVGSNKTHKWLGPRKIEAAMKAWKNWPEWWK